MLRVSIDGAKNFWSEELVKGEKLTIGNREFEVRRKGKKHLQLKETFFL
ncbi:hypothetical protein [Vibrio owensii]